MTTAGRGAAYARALVEELGGNSWDIRAIAKALDLGIREVDAEGFDGSLVRAKGIPLAAIALRNSIREASRKNFTIAHEIGHFVLPGHGESESVCAAPDIGNWTRAPRNIEREADEFAAELLMPTSVVRPIVASATPSLAVIERVAAESKASLSAAAWRYCDVTKWRCAVVWSTAEQIQWSKRSRYFGFRVRKGGPVETCTFALDCFRGIAGPGEPQPVNAALWIESRNLKAGAQIWEQSKALPNYDSVISLLWIREPMKPQEPKAGRK